MTVGLRMNLHTHLEGCVRPRTAAELAAAQGVPEPGAGWEAALRMTAPADLSVFLAHVALTYPLLGTNEALSRVTREAVEDAAADGCAFLELRAGPLTHIRPGLPLEAVIEALCDGLAQGAASTGMPCVLVVAMLREFDEEANLRLARSAVRYAGAGVAGLDLAGDELRFPRLEPYAHAFRLAADAGLGVTAHAGEAGPAAAVRQAATLLGVRRVGHGIRVAGDPDILAWAADAGLCFEVCPTSNVLTGAVASLSSHPVRSLLHAGCRVVLGDDDPVVTGSPLSAERGIVETSLGLDAADLDAISAAAVDVAFCSDAERRALLAAG